MKVIEHVLLDSDRLYRNSLKQLASPPSRFLPHKNGAKIQPVPFTELTVAGGCDRERKEEP